MKGLDAHGRFLWGLCYRMTGVAADADEIVQETYARELERKPSLEGPPEPWLTQVALNLSRDRLRQRKREAYVGPWLPSPIETDAPTAPSAAARYEELESVGIAFLLALEALSPNQRAVLLLRDVFDHSVADTARALALTETTVKTTLHRARKVMETYDKNRMPFTPELQQRTRVALESFFGALVSGDAEELTRLLRSDVRELNDGAGQYFAARVPLEGRDRVILFGRRLLQIRGMPATFEVRITNGLPSFLVTFAHSAHSEPPRALITGTIDATGQIATIYSVLADRKLTDLRF
jgi:RNA polymerase sigma factor (sigma-70 family)